MFTGYSDAGTSDVTSPIAFDIDGNNRIQGSSVDLGAFEHIPDINPITCLRLAKSVTPTVVTPGTALTYTIMFENYIGNGSNLGQPMGYIR